MHELNLLLPKIINTYDKNLIAQIYLGKSIHNNIFQKTIDRNIFKSILEYYTLHYPYSINKKIIYTYGDSKFQIRTTKKLYNCMQESLHGSPSKLIANINTNLDLLIITKKNVQTSNDKFTCIKEYHNIEEIENINIKIGEHIILNLDVSDNQYNIYITIQLLPDIKEYLTSISDVIHKIQQIINKEDNITYKLL